MKTTLNKINTFLRFGVQPNDSAAKVRAIKIANIIAMSSVLNSLIFAVIFILLKDYALANACFVAGTVYFITITISFLGFPDWGRPLNLISGALIVFWFGCRFEGDSMLQLFLFSISILPFMYFAWEERIYYIISILPVFLLIVGEFYSWGLLGSFPKTYDLKFVRIFALITPLYQIIVGFNYFLVQSVKFEKESIDNLAKLEVEYGKHIQAHKMSSLGEMAAGISHEINNPLAIILGTTYNLKKEATHANINNPVFNTGIERIESTASRIAKIVSALKTFSRNAESDPSENVNAQKLVKETLDLCHERFLNANIAIKIDINHDLEIFCRPTEISQVLVNLLNNSYDALKGSKGEWVKIAVKEFINNQIEIIIEDSGKGIDSKIQDSIMQPFYTTKSFGQGTGLGLSISKGIIESHQGKITLINDTGHTTFQILLPKGV